MIPEIARLTRLNRGTGPSTLFNLGYFEARMKMNSVAENFSAFWLESSEHARTNVALFCELDIFEYFQNGVYVGSMHNWTQPTEEHNGNNWHPLPSGTDFSQFHTYGVLWTTAEVTWYFDDQPLMSWPTYDICKTQDMFLILGAQSHGGPNDVDMTGDWVHVFR